MSQYSAYDSPPGRSFIMTVRQSEPPLGRTHADSVIAPDSRSAGASATVTTSSSPSKDSAPPKRPAPDHVAPATAPWWPWPERSPSADPAPSSKLYAATGAPGGGPVLATATSTEAVASLPAWSLARAASVWVPFAAVLESHGTAYGAEVSSAPSGCPSSRNRTPPTPLPESDAVAVTCTRPETVGGTPIDTEGATRSAVTTAVASADGGEAFRRRRAPRPGRRGSPRPARCPCRTHRSPCPPGTRGTP